MENIKFAKLYDDVIIPSKREEDGGMDIYARFDMDYIIVPPHATKMIPTGLISAFDSAYVAILHERGSTGTKGIGQRCGVIDSGYRGEWNVPITNHNERPLIIHKKSAVIPATLLEYCILYPYGKAISQCIMQKVPKLEVEECTVEEILAIKSERGNGKLGSSGK